MNKQKALGVVNQFISEAAYKTIVRPQLEYSSTVWSPYTQSYTCSYKIEMVQRRAARWTLNRYSSYDSVSEIVTTWLKIIGQEMGRCSSLHDMFYKIMNGLVAVPLPTYFQQTTRTRHGQSHPLSIHQIHTSFNFYKFSFFLLAVWQWHRLPPTAVLQPTLNQFSVAVWSLDHQMP